MNFKSIALIGLSIATVGLALPARASENAVVVDSKQTAITTGDFNDTSIKNTTRVNNRQTGIRSDDANGTSISNDQLSDTQGNFNSTRLKNKTEVNNSRRNSRY